VIILCIGLTVFGTGCASTQNMSSGKNVPQGQLATIQITSGDSASGRTTIVNFDGNPVDGSKKFITVDAGAHRLAVNFYKEIDRQVGRKTNLKVFAFGQELTKPDEPDKVTTISSTQPRTILCDLEQGKKYYVYSTDSLRRVKKTSTNQWERDLYEKLGDMGYGWEIVGSWNVEIRELK
jgi:hypothetical protein